MKIITIENNIGHGDSTYFTFRPDTAMLRNNDNFYLPHFSNDIVCGCGIIVRISRIVKHIESRFAPRCYDAIGIGVAFVARDVKTRLIGESKPCEAAYSFDHSFAISPDWIEPEQFGEHKISLAIDGITKQSFTTADFAKDINAVVAEASTLTTLKTGDYLFIGMAHTIECRQGEKVEAFADEVQMLNFLIK